MARRGSRLTLASQQVCHVLIVPIKSFLAHSVFINLTLSRPLNFSVFQKLFCFGGFIVTTFIMLILIDN